MTTQFPTGLDTFPSAATLSPASNTLASQPHSQLHANLGDSIAALEAKVGINGSAVSTSVDYILNTPGSLVVHLAGAETITGAKTFTSKLTVQTASSQYGVVHTDGTRAVGLYVDPNYGYLGTQSNTPLAFFTNNGGAQVVLLTSGNVGIGTTGPHTALEVAGVGRFTGAGAFSIGSDANQFRIDTAGPAGQEYRFLNAGNSLAGINTLSLSIGSSTAQSAGNLYVGGAAGLAIAPIGTATLLVSTAATGNIGVVVKAVASQTADLQQWQKSDGTVYTLVNANGGIQISNVQTGNALTVNGQPVTFDSPGKASAFNWSGGGLLITGNTGQGAVPIVIKSDTSQTADLQQWQGPLGGLLAKVRNDGLIAAPYFTGSTDTGPYLQPSTVDFQVVDRGAGVTQAMYVVTGGSGRTGNVARFVAGNAASVPLVVIAAASQTGDLQEWQRNDGTVLAKIDSAGKGIFGSGSNTLILDGTNAIIYRTPGGSTLAFGNASSDLIVSQGSFRSTSQGLATKVKAGTPVDGDFAATPVDGTIVVDSTANKIWVRVGGAWKGVAVA